MSELKTPWKVEKTRQPNKLSLRREMVDVSVIRRTDGKTVTFDIFCGLELKQEIVRRVNAHDELIAKVADLEHDLLMVFEQRAELAAKVAEPDNNIGLDKDDEFDWTPEQKRYLAHHWMSGDGDDSLSGVLARMRDMIAKGEL